jgi:hypothetical protein
VATALYQSGANLVVNGDFEAGRTGCTTAGQTCSGFTSDYPYTTDVNANSKYGVGQNPESDQTYFQPLRDHTKGDGTGWMYYSDGGADPNKHVYRTSVTVIKDSSYVFTVWAANIHDKLAIAGWDTTGNVEKSTNLEFSIDGIVQGRILLPINTQWHQFYRIYKAPASGTIQISIKNRETALKGNDFALHERNAYTCPC